MRPITAALVFSGLLLGQMKDPVVRFKVEAKYTAKARLARREGLVTLSFLVDTDGTPKNITVTRSLGKGLDENAIKAVKHWIFYPATLDGKPVATNVTYDFSFTLQPNIPVRIVER